MRKYVNSIVSSGLWYKRYGGFGRRLDSYPSVEVQVPQSLHTDNHRLHPWIFISNISRDFLLNVHGR